MLMSPCAWHPEKCFTHIDSFDLNDNIVRSNHRAAKIIIFITLKVSEADLVAESLFSTLTKVT